MRVGCAIAGIGLVISAACGTKADDGSTRSDQRNDTAAAPAVAGRGAGAEAAAQLTATDLDELMKKIGTGTTALDKQLMDNRLTDAATEAQRLGLWLGDVERFWAQNGKADAVAWTQAARRAATDAAGAAAGGDATSARAATVTLESNCSMCHAAYREGDASNGFRIKAGTVR
jgi:cytochrome c556